MTISEKDRAMSDLSAKMAGQMQAQADALESVKQQLEGKLGFPSATGDVDWLMQWATLDHIVCSMRETVRVWDALNRSE